MVRPTISTKFGLQTGEYVALVTGTGTATTLDSVEFVTQTGRRSGVIGRSKRGNTYTHSAPPGEEIVGVELGPRGTCQPITGVLTRRSPAPPLDGGANDVASATGSRPTAAQVAAASAGARNSNSEAEARTTKPMKKDAAASVDVARIGGLCPRRRYLTPCEPFLLDGRMAVTI
eukprot:SAG31_NODE_5871_length_2281_cov_1.539872_2_plen_174_part_00